MRSRSALLSRKLIGFLQHLTPDCVEVARWASLRKLYTKTDCHDLSLRERLPQICLNNRALLLKRCLK